MHNLVLNPFLIIALSFLFAHIAYLLPFSAIYPSISLESAAPGVYFIFLNLLAGVVWHYLHLSRSYIFKASSRMTSKLNVIGFVSCTLIVLELVVYGVPLLGQISYTDFGAPIIHVALVSSLLVLSVASIISSPRNFKWIVISLFISILILNRFLFIFISIAFLISYLSSKKFNLKYIIYSSFFIISIVFIFGLIGTWRMSVILDVPYSQAQEYILVAGHASDLYKDTNLPASFFWFWIYITSPISNLIYNVEIGNLMTNHSLLQLVGYELLPQTISKHLGDYPFKVILLSENLNVSSAIAPSYIALGFLGITLFFSYYAMIFTIVALCFKGFYRNVIVVIFSSLSFFMVFFNVIVMPIFIFSISVVLMFSLRISRSTS